MAARKVVDASMLQGLLEQSENQEVKKGSSRSTDPRFPVFTTPVDEDILVYIPRTNVVAGENGEEMKVLNAYVHDYKVGQTYGSIRCISGLFGNPLFDALGYDGTCPACDATQEVWELYRHKLNAEAARLGVDPQNDPSDILKPAREKILQEMDLRGADEYVTFPIVIIPTSGKLKPAENALQNLKPVFVTWKKKRHEEKLLSSLDALINNPGHPAGMFWHWKFSYQTGGKQATARDSAKNAKYSPILEGNQAFAALVKPCEAAAKEFTVLKAAEVIVASQFVYRDDYIKEVNKVMVKTRMFLELTQPGGAGVGVGAKQIAQSANPLANFGITPDVKPAPTGNLGVAPQPVGNPVKFGN